MLRTQIAAVFQVHRNFLIIFAILPKLVTELISTQCLVYNYVSNNSLTSLLDTVRSVRISRGNNRTACIIVTIEQLVILFARQRALNAVMLHEEFCPAGIVYRPKA